MSALRGSLSGASATRARFAGSTCQAVSRIPRGPKMRSANTRSSRWPATRSTSRPSTSVEME